MKKVKDFIVKLKKDITSLLEEDRKRTSHDFRYVRHCTYRMLHNILDTKKEEGCCYEGLPEKIKNILCEKMKLSSQYVKIMASGNDYSILVFGEHNLSDLKSHVENSCKTLLGDKFSLEREEDESQRTYIIMKNHKYDLSAYIWQPAEAYSEIDFRASKKAA